MAVPDRRRGHRTALATIAAVWLTAASLGAAPQTPSAWSDPRLSMAPASLDEELAALAPRPGQAQRAPGLEPYPNMYRRFGVSLGSAFYANFDTTAQVSTDYLVGAILDLEDFLGVSDDNLIARLDTFYSWSPRHRVDLSVFDIQREGHRRIHEDIQIGNVTIPAGDVETHFDTLIVKTAYRYNFVTDYRTAIGASFGLHTMGLDLGVKSGAFDVSESFRATAPLPLFGLHGEYALSESWKLLASFEVLQVDLGFARGYINDNLLAVEHDLFGHFGWGLALNGFTLNGEFEDSPLKADLEYGYQGVLLYLRGYW